MQASILTLECKALENSLRLRGVIEEKEGNIGEKITKLIAEYLGEETEEVTYNLDQIYRVNSKFAIQHQIPRDVVVQFSSKKMKEDFLMKSYKDPLELERKTIKVLKELPKKVIESRKQYKQLVDKLRKLKIRFRWEIPTGLSFFFKGKRKWISNVEEIKKAMKDLEKEAKNATEGGEKGEIKE